MTPPVLRTRTSLVVRKPDADALRVTEPIEQDDFDVAFYDHEGDEVSVQSVPPVVLRKLAQQVQAWADALEAVAAGADVEELT